MNHVDVKEFLQSSCRRKDGNILSKPQSWWALPANYPYWCYITEYTNFLPANSPFAQRFFHIEEELQEIPKCKHQQCNSLCRWNKQTSRYTIYCSKQCSSTDAQKVELAKATNIDRYGDHPMKTTQFKEKLKQSLIKKYGANSYSKTDEFKSKVKNTCITRYNVENPMHVIEFKDQQRETNKQLYGTEYPIQTPEILRKRTETNFKIYGGASPMCSSSVKEKFVETCQAKYGVPNPIQLQVDPGSLNILSNKDAFHELVLSKGKTAAATLLNVDLTTISNYIKKYELIDLYFLESSLETQIAEILTRHNLEFRQRDRKIIAPQELDFFLPDYNIAIECNGTYWHSTEHKQDKNYHFNKWKACKEKGILLLTYYENEIKNASGVIESKILYLTKKLQAIKVGAREVTLGPVSVTAERNFLNQNHIQGFLQSRKFSVGAYFKKELVGIICASITKNNELEISRYATKLDYLIPGLFSKLLSALVAQLGFTGVVTSFSDNAHGNGNLYRSAGFVIDKIQAPVYYYINPQGEKEHRQRFMKSKIEKRFNISAAGKTEDQLMKELKYLKVWDCGKIKWKKEIK